ncbi:MAG: porphobilinogen synthase [Candidatus Meridianibacter frigidus]|nr:MAG: porphobilinogen synthase [Candidatus Eremiobacteraeota bacterium]
MEVRMRRLRTTHAMRQLVREADVRPHKLIQPLFVVEDESAAGPISSMPGILRMTKGQALEECRALHDAGMGGMLLFGLPKVKDAAASSNADPDGIVQQTVRAVKDALPDFVVIADLCNCEYTDHGHCGVLNARGDIDNDATLDLLARTALSYARAGVDVVAPSDMMDGRVRAIRAALDDDGFTHTAIMSYAAKYASAFYGPFREAANCAPQFGDRRTYQMNPANGREAMREIELDIQEGADIILIKPGLAYLDIVAQARRRFDVPLAVYNVSGEYAMLHAAAEKGWIERETAIDELLVSFARAGADIIITYFAKEYARRAG